MASTVLPGIPDPPGAISALCRDHSPHPRPPAEAFANGRPRQILGQPGCHDRTGDENADPLRPDRHRRLDASQSDPHGALDPLSRRHPPGAESADADLLRAARLGGPHPERGHLGGAHGRRLSRHAGDLVRRAGGWLEAGHVSRARGGRAHVPPALACRPDLRSQLSRQCAARGAQRHRGERQCEPASACAALSRSPCAGGQRDPRYRPRVPPWRGECPGRRLRRRRDPWGERLSAGSVSP